VQGIRPLSASERDPVPPTPVTLRARVVEAWGSKACARQSTIRQMKRKTRKVNQGGWDEDKGEEGPMEGAVRNDVAKLPAPPTPVTTGARVGVALGARESSPITFVSVP
jgi:hypothetical protein